MRLNATSMQKLVDLMTMAFKYQVINCCSPEELLTVTCNHLRSQLDLLLSMAHAAPLGRTPTATQQSNGSPSNPSTNRNTRKFRKPRADESAVTASTRIMAQSSEELTESLSSSVQTTAIQFYDTLTRLSTWEFAELRMSLCRVQRKDDFLLGQNNLAQ
eukprot:GHVS01040189.1.p1 GENE.GHVS01040189.1~~GHVS01040189.1.p1  ORF type:complete len:159 (+),score=19.12 GHVS01040189.1:271-747(+)